MNRGHRVDSLALSQHAFRYRAGVKNSLRLNFRYLPPQQLLREDSSCTGIGLVNKQNGTRTVGDVYPVVKVFTDTFIVPAFQFCQMNNAFS